MRRKQYIKVKPLENIRINDKKEPERQDKVARIYALAEQLHVKIGGNR